MNPEKVLLALIQLAIVLVNIYVLAWRLSVVVRLPHEHFLEQDEVSALNWLAENAAPEDVVFSAIEVGQYIPSRTGARPFLAHWAMTKDVFKKEEIVEAFFRVDTTDDERRGILQTFSVDYVLVGPDERTLGDYDPTTSSFLKACFEAPQATIYCVWWDRFAERKAD